jgi:GNAT superfamily N-acetyltransferase
MRSSRGGTTALETPYTPQALADAYLTGPEVHCCFVATDPLTGRIEGFQTLGRNPPIPNDIGDIATFARVGSTQRGVGSALFKATRLRVHSLGLVAINATIRADNEGWLAFYGRQGFVDRAVRKAVPLADGTPVDRIIKHHVLIDQD